MKVFYNTCLADPFVYVAKKMQEDYNYEPVYWVGYDDDNSEALVQRLLPNTKYHSWRDAFKAVFPPDIDNQMKFENIDIDSLKSIAQEELLALRMMDRLDDDRYSFNLMERERHFQRLLKGWKACFHLYKPDIVISGVNPHRIYDYVLYVLCKQEHIPFLNFQHTLCYERTYCVNGIYTIGDIFQKSFDKYMDSSEELTKECLSDEIRLQYEKVVKSYSEAIPDYMKQHEVDNKKYSNIFYMLKLGLSTYTKLGDNKAKSSGEFSLKKKNESLENSRFSLFEAAKMRLGEIKYKNKLRDLYNSLVSSPTGNEDYILFPLHYQPEETTSPIGDIFVNQQLAIETLLKNTPENVFIYVKEHPQQFQSHMAGQKCRIREFYTDLAKLPRVKFMPLGVNTFSLMRKAKAVVTVTGTVGWEAVMHRKPVIIFGFVWYEKIPGVLRITDSESATHILDFITNYKYNEKGILAYLKAYEDNSVYAYHYYGQKEYTNLNTDACAGVLSKYLHERINHFIGNKKSS